MQIDPKPVFEQDQVLTFYDLMALRNGYIFQYRRTPWYQFKNRLKFRAGVGVVNEMLHWLAHGKPPGGTTCQGGHDDKTV